MAQQNDSTTVPTLEQLCEATGGKLSRDGDTVVVGFGPIGFLRLTPDTVFFDGVPAPAARIEGRLSRRNGGHQSELRSKLRAAGIEVR